MSQYCWENEGFEFRIGWDRPLHTFFLIVSDSSIDDSIADPVIEWLGGVDSEYGDLREMINNSWQITLDEIPVEVLKFVESDRTGNSAEVRDLQLPDFVKKTA